MELDTDDEEIVIDEDEDEEMMDMAGLLTSLMATEDGDTVCTALVNINNNLEKMSKHMDTQNKILIKIMGLLNK